MSARARRAVAGCLAMLASAWLLFHFYDRFWYPPDEGNYAHVAQRILEGETLNRDVQDIHPGYINFLNAAALGTFGPDLISLRYPLLLAGLLQAAVLFLVFPRHDPWRAAIAAIAVTALGAIQFLNPTAHWYCLALVIVLIVVLGSGPATTKRLVIAGLLIGTIALFRQLTGFLAGIGALTFLLWPTAASTARGWDALLGRIAAAAMALALGVYLALATDVSGVVLFGLCPLLLLIALTLGSHLSNREVVRTLGCVAAGICLAAFPLVVYHASRGSLAAWIGDVGPTAIALTQLDFFDRTNFGALMFHALQQLVAGDPALFVNGLYWTILPLLAVLNGALLLRHLSAIRDAERARGPHDAHDDLKIANALPVVAVFYGIVSVHFQIPIYLYYSAGLSLASLLWLTAPSSTFVRRASLAAALALAATGVYFHAGQPSSRSIYAILRGDRASESQIAALAHASLKVEPQDVARYEAIVELIHQKVPAGDSIFAVPSNAELYFLAQRRNAFKFYNTALGVRTDADLAAVERELREHPPKLVTFNPDDKYNTPRSWQLMEAIKHRYVLLGKVEPFEVYVLR